MKARFVIVVALAAGLAAGCTGTTDPGGAPYVEFPLEIGRSWDYVRTFTVESSDTLDAVPADTATAYCTEEIVRLDTLSMRTDAYVLREVGIEDSATSWDLESYYRSERDGLYLLAYEPGATLVNPRPHGRPRFLFKGMTFASVREITSYVTGAVEHAGGRPDTLYYEDPPVRTLRYPLRVGASWNFRQPGQPWRIDKEVTGTREVDVPAGAFDCLVVEWFIDIGDDGQWDDDIEFIDYFAPEGLIRRRLVFSDMIAVDPEGDTLGVFHSVDDAQLTAYSVD